MKEETIVCSVVIFVLLLTCSVDPVCAKRAFAIRMRSKSNANSGGLSRYSRKNHHNPHMSENVSGGMVRNPPVPDAQPARPAGWNVDSTGPVGPPPAYPGLGHHAVPAGGAPPAYARVNPPSYAEAMGYSSHGHGYGAVAAPGRHYDYNTNNNNLHSSVYSDNNIGGYGSNYAYHRGANPFSVGNILTGVALWQLGHGIAHAGHNHHHHQHTDYYSNYYDHHHDTPEETAGSTLATEMDNPHIQVNADFDFGPTSASTTAESVQKSPGEPIHTSSTGESSA